MNIPVELNPQEIRVIRAALGILYYADYQFHPVPQPGFDAINGLRQVLANLAAELGPDGNRLPRTYAAELANRLLDALEADDAVRRMEGDKG